MLITINRVINHWTGLTEYIANKEDLRTSELVWYTITNSIYTISNASKQPGCLQVASGMQQNVGYAWASLWLNLQNWRCEDILKGSVTWLIENNTKTKVVLESLLIRCKYLKRSFTQHYWPMKLHHEPNSLGYFWQFFSYLVCMGHHDPIHLRWKNQYLCFFHFCLHPLAGFLPNMCS